MVIAPALYVGTLRHRRLQPRPHRFSYSLFMSLLDIDRVGDAMAVSHLTSHNRFNVASFDDRDHLPGAPPLLRDRLELSASAAGHALPDGRVLLLTHLRYAGYVFNPISIYYCHDKDGALQLVMADVRNTYGGRRQYWLPAADRSPRRFRASVAKTLFVSPFMDGELDYEFVLTPPSRRLIVHMNVNERGDGHQRRFDATLSMQALPWTAASIRRVLTRHPFMTAKVIGAIHWEALRLRWKGLPEYSPGTSS